MIIRYMRDENRQPWGCIVMLDADHIGWTVCNPTDRWNKKLARDGGVVWSMNRHGPYVKYSVVGARTKAETCGPWELAEIEMTPLRFYVPGQWRRQAIEREVFIMRKWAQAREARK